MTILLRLSVWPNSVSAGSSSRQRGPFIFPFVVDTYYLLTYSTYGRQHHTVLITNHPVVSAHHLYVTAAFS